MNKEPRYKEVVVDFVDRVHGTGFPEIRPWKPQLAIPVEILDIVTGTDSYPSSEVIIELVVGDNHILPDPFNAIYIREKPVKDGPSLHIQEGLGKVLGQGIEPGCIAGCEDEAGHE